MGVDRGMKAPLHVVILDAHLELTLGGESEPAFAGTVRRVELMARQAHPRPDQYLTVTFGAQQADLGAVLSGIFDRDAPSRFLVRDEDGGRAYRGRIHLSYEPIEVVPYEPITFLLSGGARAI